MFTYIQAWVSKGGTNLKISAIRLFSQFRVVKNKFHHFWPLTQEKLLEKSTSGPHWKKLPDAHAHKHVKLHQFCKKLCCITPYRKTVQQHQCGKQAVAG